ncbi:MAG: nucleoside triphosphate pyrophosphatase [Microbacteriaceae bacterium]|jgi:septum formation protein|nr:nucleoside triphosphate pyrophosphatase [Microbacteriaceae bacterium]
MRLYLASTSPARLALLRAAGVEPIVVPSHVDEPAAVAAAEAEHGPLSPAVMVEHLARVKAEAVTETLVDGLRIDGFILGGDSAFEVAGAVHGKPHTPEVARERWLAQRGTTGSLYSGHWLIDHRGGTTRAATGATSVATVTFADNITDAEIDAYIATGEPLKVAGAFTIDSLGGPFITRITGDPSTVVGLSLATLRELFLEFEVEWPSLWNRARL